MKTETINAIDKVRNAYEIAIAEQNCNISFEEYITTYFTDSQIIRKVIAATKQWLKKYGYENKIMFRYIRGTFHFDNCGNYLLSANDILQQATGFQFTYYNTSMARLHNPIQSI